MKMTTEQFLSHLGIEVEQEFMCKGNRFDYDTKYKIDSLFGIWYYSKNVKQWFRSGNIISSLIDQEITPLPKYTLTEEEKAIVRLEFVGDACIYRYCNEDLVIEVDGDDTVLLDDKLFPFVNKEKSIPLDELRKCL